jgi:signal peptidase I
MENMNIENNENYNEPTTMKNSGKTNFLWDILKFALLAIVIVLPIRMYIASPFIVSGSSMEPTFATGNYLIVDQISYRFENPARGEVIVFRYPNDPSKFFIKRVIGLPGETVKIQDGKILIKNNGADNYIGLDEPYLKYLKHDNLITTLKESEYFMMGDNREASSDSRAWGPLRKEFITGKVMVRLLPIKGVGINPGEATYK